MIRRRLLPGLFIAAWIGTAAYFFGLHVLGDTGRHAFGYFWTWDMYTGYATVSSRRVVLARTEDDRWLRLLPDARHRYRLFSITGDRLDDGIPVPRGLSRFDMNRTSRWLRRAVGKARRRWQAPGNEPITELYVLDRFWPVRFNLREGLYRRAYGQSNPRRRYWRIAGYASVDAAGRAVWAEQE